MRGDVERAVHRRGRFDQALHRQLGGAHRIEQAARALDVLHRFHLGDHHVAQLAPRLARDGGDVLLEGVMPDRVDAHRHARLVAGQRSERHDQGRVLGFTADGRAVFAVQRHVEDAGAELLGHLGLQLQALAHPRLDAAVMVANGQGTGLCLRAEEDFTRMLH